LAIKDLYIIDTFQRQPTLRLKSGKPFDPEYGMQFR